MLFKHGPIAIPDSWSHTRRELRATQDDRSQIECPLLRSTATEMTNGHANLQAKQKCIPSSPSSSSSSPSSPSSPSSDMHYSHALRDAQIVINAFIVDAGDLRDCLQLLQIQRGQDTLWYISFRRIPMA